jgi:hypothetical protein
MSPEDAPQTRTGLLATSGMLADAGGRGDKPLGYINRFGLATAATWARRRQ